MPSGPEADGDVNEIFVGESAKLRSFTHPITGARIEYSPRMPEEQRLRLISDSSALFGDFKCTVFTAFMPDDIEPTPFDKASVDHPKEVETTHEERVLRRLLMKTIGYKSVRKNSVDRGDMPDLHVGFTNDPDAIVTMLNRIPMVRRMQDIAQTIQAETLLPAAERKQLGIPLRTLLDHSNHCGYWVQMTNIRLGIQTPKLYMQRIAKDMREFSHQYEHLLKYKKTFSLFRSDEEKKQALQEIDTLIVHSELTETEKIDADQKEALATALQYGKYLAIYAILHDVESPGWKDVVMNTRARVPGQKSIEYSEDKQLVQSIDYHIEHGLDEIISTHNLDPELLRIMVKCWASESSPTLGGYLLKDKRKDFNARTEYSAFPQGQGYDHDQESGTITNAQDLANRYLPGGFRHLNRTDVHPVGSFEERARLLVYAVAAHLTKDQLSKAMRQLGIDPNRLYIAAEEISVGPNVALKEYRSAQESDYVEIVPVATVPGDVKKAITMFNILYLYYYVGEMKVPIELFTQDAIAFGIKTGQIDAKMFRYRGDSDVAQRLNEFTPALPWFQSDAGLVRGARVLSEYELYFLSKDGPLQNMLVTRLEHHPKAVMEKPGTLVYIQESEEILPYKEVIGQKKESRLAGEKSINPLSLPARLHAVQEALKNGPWFLVVDLPTEKQAEMQRLLRGTEDPVYQALNLWTQPLTIRGTEVKNALRDVFFRDVSP